MNEISVVEVVNECGLEINEVSNGVILNATCETLREAGLPLEVEAITIGKEIMDNFTIEDMELPCCEKMVEICDKALGALSFALDAIRG